MQANIDVVNLIRLGSVIHGSWRMVHDKNHDWKISPNRPTPHCAAVSVPPHTRQVQYVSNSMLAKCLLLYTNRYIRRLCWYFSCYSCPCHITNIMIRLWSMIKINDLQTVLWRPWNAPYAAHESYKIFRVVQLAALTQWNASWTRSIIALVSQCGTHTLDDDYNGHAICEPCFCWSKCRWESCKRWTKNRAMWYLRQKS